MNRKPLMIITGLWLLFIIVPVGLAIFRSLQGFHVHQEYQVPSSFSAVAPFGGDAVVYSNGQALASYNYTNGQASALSSNVGLAAIDTVSTSSGRYVAFHDGAVLQTGNLALQLNAQGVAPNADYWWLFDAQTRDFQTLPSNTLIAKLFNGKLYALQYTNGGESIATYQLPGLKQIATQTVQGSSDFQPTPNGYLLESANNQVFFTNNGAVNQVILDDGTLSGVTSDGQSMLAVSVSGSTRNLIVMDLQTNKVTTVARNIANLPMWLDSGVALYADTTGNLYSYNLTTHKTSQWKLSGNLGKLKQNLKLESIIGPNVAIVNDNTNNYLVGAGIVQPSALQ